MNFNKYLKRVVPNAAALAALLLVGAPQAQAQLEGSSVFLKGKYIEVAMAENGQFGAPDGAPEGYHPRGGGAYCSTCFGFVADPALDGWEEGTPDYIGCYFLPGFPQEGWDMSVDGTWYYAYAGTTPYGSSFAGGSWSGDITGYGTEGSRVYATWEGDIDDLHIKKKVSLDTNQVFFLVEVELKNNGTTDIPDIFYSRTLDPDNESSVPGGGGAVTTNVIEHQPDFATGDYRALVSGTGLNFPELSYLGLGTVDCRATAYILTSGLAPSEGPENVKLGGNWNIDSGYTSVQDVAIGLVFDIGTLAPGDSTIFTYSYVLSAADLDTALNSIETSWIVDGTSYDSGDTIRTCWGSDLEASINGGGAYVWGEWEVVSPDGGPTLPAGRSNTIEAEHTILTYRVIGTTTICPVSDTMFLTVIPEGDSVIINESICQGETYNFMGALKYETGVYINSRKTSIGCDSIVQLNLTVNPLPNTKISARETEICEGEEALFSLDSPSSYASYQWYRDGYSIPGATQSYYAATTAGVYHVVGTSNRGCIDDSRKITLRVNPAAEGSIVSISEQDVCYGDTVVVSSDAKAGYQYTWSPEAYFRYTGGIYGATANAVIPEGTPIYLVSMNEYGCRDYDTAFVQAHPCCDIYIPTGFTPNGDGLNDEFMPNLRPGQVIVTLQIFNRNGQMVYDNESPQKGWNGLMNNTGSPVAQDVYMYRFVYTCTDGEVYETKGDITVIK